MNGLRLSREGVSYPIQRPNGDAGEAFISFAQGVMHSIEGGQFFLYRKGDGKPVAQLPCETPDFFTGFALLERLAAEANAARDAGGRG